MAGEPMELKHEVKHATGLLAGEQDHDPSQFVTDEESDSSQNHDDKRRDQEQEAEKRLETTGLGFKFKSEFCWFTVWFSAKVGEFVKHVC